MHLTSLAGIFRTVRTGLPFLKSALKPGLALAALLVAAPVHAANSNPPDFMTYQGFLADQNATPLGNAAPVNYQAIFRIYSVPTDGTALWGESQVITVDKGNFSVILGQGNDSGDLRPALSTVFSTAPNASDRFIGISVKIGNGNYTEILPRLRMVPSAYSFLASQARNANNLADASGAVVAAISPIGMSVAGTVSATGQITASSASVSGDISAATFTGSAAKLSNIPANQISSGTLPDARLSANIARRDQANTFASDIAVNNNLSVGSNLSIGNNFSMVNEAIMSAKNASGTSEFFLWPRWSDNAMYINYGTGGFNIRNNNYALSMRIDHDGRVGINTPPYDCMLHIRQKVDVGGYARLPDGIKIQSANGNAWVIGTQSGGDLVFDGRDTANNGTAYAFLSKSSGTFQIGSDVRLKKNVQPMEKVLERVLKLRPVTFQYKHQPDDSKPIVGFIAQEVKPLFPETVETKEDFMSIGYAAFGPIAIGAVKELSQQVDELKAGQSRMAELEKKAARVDALEQEVAELRKMVLAITAARDAAKPVAQADSSEPSQAVLRSVSAVRR